MVHELAHLYCGHLGTPHETWWPDRKGLSHEATEIEAESVAYLVCGRAGVDCRSERYLKDYVRHHENVAHQPRADDRGPGLLEEMSRRRMTPRTV